MQIHRGGHRGGGRDCSVCVLVLLSRFAQNEGAFFRGGGIWAGGRTGRLLLSCIRRVGGGSERLRIDPFFCMVFPSRSTRILAP